MGDSGISMNDVHRAIAPVENRVNGLETAVSQLSGRLRELEAEMAAIGNAIQAMHRDLVNNLQSDFESVGRKADEQREEVVKQTRRVENAVESGLDATRTVVAVGLAASTAATAVVSLKVDKGTLTAGELEYMRVFHEAREPLKQVAAFSHEIGERFKMSLESVGEERLRNDALFARVTEGLDRKMRLIGEHIFKVYEQDFARAVAAPLAHARLEHHEPALAIDDERMEARAHALNIGLEAAFQEVVEPLMGMQRKLEATLRDQASVQSVALGDFFIPVNVVLKEGAVEWQASRDAAAVLPAVKQLVGDARALPTRSIDQNEFDQIAMSIRAIAQSGKIGADEAELIIQALAREGFRVATDHKHVGKNR